VNLGSLRLSLGTLTVFPVGAVAPKRSDAGPAMLFAPAVGAILGAIAGGTAWTCARLDLPALVAAGIGLAVLAGLTRGLHLDGLADTADGLGCGKDPAGALAVMKASDIGPFGVVTLMLTLLIQAAALAGQLGRGHDSRALTVMIVAATAGRANLPRACRIGVPAARSEGLGALVAGTVDELVALIGLIVVVGAASVLAGLTGFGFVRGAVAVLLGWAAAELLLRQCVSRFGGVTGDVLGALVEVGTSVALVVLATAPAR
jgi:adenosylcobinamide-GDP ribazoletransferase